MALKDTEGYHERHDEWHTPICMNVHLGCTPDPSRVHPNFVTWPNTYTSPRRAHVGYSLPMAGKTRCYTFRPEVYTTPVILGEMHILMYPHVGVKCTQQSVQSDPPTIIL